MSNQSRQSPRWIAALSIASLTFLAEASTVSAMASPLAPARDPILYRSPYGISTVAYVAHNRRRPVPCAKGGLKTHLTRRYC